MRAFKLHLIRHGLTQGNIEGIYMGGGMDLPLCAEGARQLGELAARYRYPGAGVVFCSPMLRAVQSADILYPQLKERIVLEALRENHFGAFEGRRVEELMNDADFAKWMDPQSGFVPEGGESGAAFAQRTANALMTMMGHLARGGISEGVCVTHGGVIMSMLSQCALPRRPFPQWMCDNGCGYTVQADAAMLMRDGLVEAMGIVPYGYLGEEG